jgi:hypothetical protein
MKYLNKYNKFSINEGKFEDDGRDELLPNLIDIMYDFIDDGYNVQFESMFNRISVDDFINKNVKLVDFKPIYKAGNKIKSLFRVLIFPNPRCEYKKFVEIASDMIPALGRIEDMGWVMGKFEQWQDESGRFTTLSYTFTKPDVKTEDEPPSIDEIKKRFEHFGLNVEDIEYEDNICHVSAESSAYNGEIPHDIEDKLDRMIQELGFDYYEHETSGGNTWLSVKFWVDSAESEE